MKHTDEEQKELRQLATLFEGDEFTSIYNYEMESARRDRAAERIKQICKTASEREA